MNDATFLSELSSSLNADSIESKTCVLEKAQLARQNVRFC